MKASLRFAVFVTTAVAALAAVPIRAADAVLPPAKPRVELGSGGPWSLRPAGWSGRREETAAAPVRMRVVRLVYPPLIEPR